MTLRSKVPAVNGTEKASVHDGCGGYATMHLVRETEIPEIPCGMYPLVKIYQYNFNFAL